MLMKTDELGIPRFTNKDLVDMIYSGHADKCHVVLCDSPDDIDKLITAMEEQGLAKLKNIFQMIPKLLMVCAQVNGLCPMNIRIECH